jgi:4-diphosphocytidyl-2-C-methyl-D-erythritol kinase
VKTRVPAVHKRPSRSLVLRPSAKINLTLHVGPRRADGFHDVRTILQSIALSDRLTLTPSRGPIELTITGADAPPGRDNLVWRAAEALWRAAGRAGEPHGVRMALRKAIPSAAGLGGGSADAAAALAGLNILWNLGLPRRELIGVAAGLGSDVPFFLVCGTALGMGRGEDLVPLADIRPQSIVIVKPAAGVSTADAYGWFDGDGPPAAAPAGELLELGWPTGPLALRNDLQPGVIARRAEVGRALALLRKAGASAAAMSGSGSAVFGVCSPSVALSLGRRLRAAGWVAFVTRTLSRRDAARRVGLC